MEWLDDQPTYSFLPSLEEIAVKSIFPTEYLYDQIIIISVKTCNNYEILSRLPYTKFVQLTKALSRYIEAENKQTNGDQQSEAVSGYTQNFADQFGKMQNSVKSNFKLPKLK